MKEACFIAVREYPTALGRRDSWMIIAQDFRSIATDRIDDIFVGLDP
jgi:hypothetical protein